MSSNSIFDAFAQLFQAAMSGTLVGWLPALILHSLGLWFASVGWLRHRQLGFALFLGAALMGLGASGLSAFAFMQLARGTALSQGTATLFSSASAVHGLASILEICALGHLAFRGRFVPVQKPEIYQP